MGPDGRREGCRASRLPEHPAARGPLLRFRGPTGTMGHHRLGRACGGGSLLHARGDFSRRDGMADAGAGKYPDGGAAFRPVITGKQRAGHCNPEQCGLQCPALRFGKAERTPSAAAVRQRTLRVSVRTNAPFIV